MQRCRVSRRIHLATLRHSRNVVVTTTPLRPLSTTGATIRKCKVLVPSCGTTALVDSLLCRTQRLIDPRGSNVVAFSGGVDSSLAAALVVRAFRRSNGDGSVEAVLGISPAVPQSQIATARSVSKCIGTELLEVKTEEGSDPRYVANRGESCLVCKTHLYSALQAVVASIQSYNDVTLFNGTNADDTRDPTRLGLVAASNFSVRSPILYLTKQAVRRVAKHLGLPNWNHAAAPCLRSRLAFGVDATHEHLARVDKAENRIRHVLNLDVHENMRVRMLSGNRAMVELDSIILDHFGEDAAVETFLENKSVGDYFRNDLKFSSVSVRRFKSGNVAAVAPPYHTNLVSVDRQAKDRDNHEESLQEMRIASIRR